MNEVSIIDGTCKVLFLDEQHDLVEFPTMEMTMCHSYMEYKIKKTPLELFCTPLMFEIPKIVVGVVVSGFSGHPWTWSHSSFEHFGEQKPPH